jgi:hypothetical protein
MGTFPRQKREHNNNGRDVFYAVRGEVFFNQDQLAVNEHVRSIGQGEARYRKYKRPKPGGGEAYDPSSD